MKENNLYQQLNNLYYGIRIYKKTPEGIEKVTSMLAVAFDTTLVALVLSVILMYLVHSMHKQQDDLFTKMNSYIIENLINRFYK